MTSSPANVMTTEKTGRVCLLTNGHKETKLKSDEVWKRFIRVFKNLALSLSDQHRCVFPNTFRNQGWSAGHRSVPALNTGICGKHTANSMPERSSNKFTYTLHRFKNHFKEN